MTRKGVRGWAGKKGEPKKEIEDKPGGWGVEREGAIGAVRRGKPFCAVEAARVAAPDELHQCRGSRQTRSKKVTA